MKKLSVHTEHVKYIELGFVRFLQWGGYGISSSVIQHRRMDTQGFVGLPKQLQDYCLLGCYVK
jgi:hypothetical protein